MTENSQLKEQLDEWIATDQGTGKDADTAQISKPAEASTGLSEDEPDWKMECAKVSSKFKALSENFKKAKEALRKRKDERDRWAEHATSLEKKIRASEEEHGIQIVDRSSRSTRANTHLDVTTEPEASKPSPSTSFTSEAGLDQADLELPPLAAASLSSEGNAPIADTTAANPNSDSTQSDDSKHGDELPQLRPDNNPGYVRVKEEPSSDSPVMISERAVRKRKRNDPTDDPHESPVQKVKTEVIESSSPVASRGPAPFELQESIDLGDVAQRLLTPRKRRELEESQRREQELGETFATTTPKLLFVRPDPQPQTARPLEPTSALTPLSVNRRIKRSSGEKPSEPEPRRKGLNRGISGLADDGETYRRDSNIGLQKGATPVPKGRLDTLLNSPSTPSNEPIIRSPRPRARPSLMAEDLAIPGRRELPFEQEARLKSKTPGQPTPATARTSAASHRLPAQDTRSPLATKAGSTSILRNKRLSDLRPDDFKINPQANEGHDFAFSDVVRDKDERARLQGCTDMHCCGKHWRPIAISQRPDSPLTAAQRQEEQKLLEDYLGDFSYRLATMDRAEKDELWIEAKTQALANKHGRHRHHYSRMQSPPGFWNFDFPDTQELEAEREEAARREKRTVQERYREAMRPGGRWKFRDD